MSSEFIVTGNPLTRSVSPTGLDLGSGKIRKLRWEMANFNWKSRSVYLVRLQTWPCEDRNRTLLGIDRRLAHFIQENTNFMFNFVRGVLPTGSFLYYSLSCCSTVRTIQNDNLQNLLFNHFGTNFVIWLSYHNLAEKKELSLEAKITVNAFSSVKRGKLIINQVEFQQWQLTTILSLRLLWFRVSAQIRLQGAEIDNLT